MGEITEVGFDELTKAMDGVAQQMESARAPGVPLALLDLAGVVGDAILDELDARRDLEQTEGTLEWTKRRVLADAFNGGVIDGKNAEHRARQAADVLDRSDEVTELRQKVWDLQREADDATAARAQAERYAKLLQAWFYYSRGGEA